MPSYSQLAKPVAWSLLVFTLLLTLLIIFGIGMVVIFREVIHSFMMPEMSAISLGKLAGVLLIVLVPAVYLSNFYLKVAAGRSSAGFSRIGWLASTVYHSTLTCLIVALSPRATVSTSHGSGMPLFFLTGAAALVSLYLLIKYPRPPKLPTAGDDGPLRATDAERLRLP